MENREFIAAKDLPEIEEETLDVLCVNPKTGEMGKKSGVALGGGDKADLVIRADRYPEDTSKSPNFEIISGSIEEVFDIYESGGFPTVEVEIAIPINVTEYIRPAFRIVGNLQFYGGDIYIQFLYPGRPNTPTKSSLRVCRMTYSSFTKAITWYSHEIQTFYWD